MRWYHVEAREGNKMRQRFRVRGLSLECAAAKVLASVLGGGGKAPENINVREMKT